MNALELLMRRRMLATQQGLYRQVGWIKNPSQACVDTLISNINPTNTTIKVVTKANFYNLTSEQYLVGSFHSSGRIYCIGKHQSSSGIYCCCGTAPSGVSSVTISTNIDYEIESTLHSGSNSLTANGATVSNAKTMNFTNPNNICIFGRNTADGAPAKCSLYYLKMYLNDVLVRDFIPCVLTSNIPDSKCANASLPHTTGTAGLWDLVEDKFYGNSGTGSFVVPE